MRCSGPRDFLSNASAENAETFSKPQQLYIAESGENAETFSKSQQLYIAENAENAEISANPSQQCTLLKMLKNFKGIVVGLPVHKQVKSSRGM